MTSVAIENGDFVYGKTHYFDWVMFNSYVKLPEGIVVFDVFDVKMKCEDCISARSTISPGFGTSNSLLNI